MACPCELTGQRHPIAWGRRDWRTSSPPSSADAARACPRGRLCRLPLPLRECLEPLSGHPVCRRRRRLSRFLLVRYLVGHAHKAKGVAPVARPIVFGAKTNVSRLVLLLVIPAERIAPA